LVGERVDVRRKEREHAARAHDASNLDEFVMKRVGGLKQQVAGNVHQLTVDGRTPAQQITECHAEIREQERLQRAVLAELLGELHANDVHVRSYGDLSPAEHKAVREDNCANGFPLVTPLAIDPAHPFPSSRTCR
jgi:polyphosphate kinase